jgi:hypothetical protein
LPVEDAWTAGVMPKEKQFIWAWGYYEMRYVYFPDELNGYNPTWINDAFLEKGVVDNGVLKIGNAAYKALYIKSEYLSSNVVKRLNELAEAGLKIVLKNVPKEPGAIAHPDYSALVGKLKTSPKVTSGLQEDLVPFLSGNSLPRHWCRKEGETLYIFFPHPKADRLKFPMEYGQALETETKRMQVIINYNSKKYPLKLVFGPYQSLLYKIENGRIKQIDIRFIPKNPVVIERPANYEAPWLVK